MFSSVPVETVPANAMDTNSSVSIACETIVDALFRSHRWRCPVLRPHRVEQEDVGVLAHQEGDHRPQHDAGHSAERVDERGLALPEACRGQHAGHVDQRREQNAQRESHPHHAGRRSPAIHLRESVRNQERERIGHDSGRQHPVAQCERLHGHDVRYDEQGREGHGQGYSCQLGSPLSAVLKV